MSEIRYQVFISSTFNDLKEDRAAVTEALLLERCFPIGMEIFPATDFEQFDYIKRVIDDSDYYILLIGGCYGSLDSDGISYTEKEFDYAVEKGIPIITFIKEDSEIVKDKIDIEKMPQLVKFKNKATSKRLMRKYTNLDNLKWQVSSSLKNTIQSIPRTGWVRGDLVKDNKYLENLNTYLEELNEVKSASQVKDDTINKLTEEVNKYKNSINRDMMQNDELITSEIDVVYDNSDLKNYFVNNERLNNYLDNNNRITIRINDIFQYISIEIYPQKTFNFDNITNIFNTYVETITIKDLVNEVCNYENDIEDFVSDYYQVALYKESVIKILLIMEQIGIIEHNGSDDYYITDFGNEYMKKNI